MNSLMPRRKTRLVQALDKWAERYRDILLQAFDKWTHRHAALSTLFTERYGETFERLGIKEIDFTKASSKSLSFWCGDSLLTTTLAEDFEYGHVIRKLVGGDGRVYAYVGEFHNSTPVPEVESEIRSILDQAELALLEGRVDLDLSAISFKSARARQTWSELEQEHVKQ